MRHFIWIAMLIAAQTNATFLRVDFTTNGLNGSPSGWTFPSPRPTTITGSFLLDTSLATSEFTSFTDANGVTCVNSVESTMAGSLLNLSADGTTLFGRKDGSVGFSGDTPGNCQPDQQFYFSGLTMQVGDFNFLLSLDSHHPISFADFSAAGDPLAALLNGAFGNGFLVFNDATGQAQASVGDFHISNVAEPGAAALLLAGLLAMAITRSWKRRGANR